MKLELICIGDELLIGQTTNTNLAFIGRKLSENGYTVAREQCIPDSKTGIINAVTDSLANADVVVTVGGLGPTSDDLTRDAVAAALGQTMIPSDSAYAAIRSWLGDRTALVPEESVRTQAKTPERGEWLPNQNGTAPALWFENGANVVICLPGPPRELNPILQESVLPRLVDRFPPDQANRICRTAGIPESVLATRVEPVLRKQHPQVALAYCARPFEVDVRFTVPDDQRAGLDGAEATLRDLLGDAVFPPGAESLPEAVGQCLSEAKATLAVAESCTGGLIGADLTGVPGSSAFFLGGIIAYDNDCKHRLLGVPKEDLERHGAVSPEVAEAMARGAQERTGANFAIAVTGIAGPGGATEEKPVGLVYIALASSTGVDVLRNVFPGNRAAIRRRTVTTALNALRNACKN